MALRTFNKGVKKLIWLRVGPAFRLRRTGLRSIHTYSRHVSIILSAIIWELTIGHWPFIIDHIYHNNPCSSRLEIFKAVNLRFKNWIKDSTTDTTNAYLSQEYLLMYNTSISLAKSF